MSVELRVFLLIGGMALIAIAFNVAALLYAKRHDILNTTIARERPTTRVAASVVIRMVWLETAGIVVLTCLDSINRYYTLTTIVNDSPTFLTFLILFRNFLNYGLFTLLPLFLIYLGWSLKEHDKLIEVRLRRHKSYQQRRNNDARTD